MEERDSIRRGYDDHAATYAAMRSTSARETAVLDEFLDPVPDASRILDEFARVLRAGGRLLVSESPEEFERTNDDWLGTGTEMRWHMAGAAETRRQLRTAGFRIAGEWEPSDSDSGNGPRPPFFAARLAEPADPDAAER